LKLSNTRAPDNCPNTGRGNGLRICEDKHIAKKIIVCDYDVVNIDVEIKHTS
jgi:hypothetical protein